MGGGPDPRQLRAADAQAALDTSLGQAFNRSEAFKEQQQQAVNPFYQGLLKNGLPYFNSLMDAQSGLNAQAFAPARAQLERQLNQNPNSLPSGYAQQARTDLASNQARSFDQGMQGALGANLQARQSGAAGMLGQASLANPTAYSGQAIGGNQSIMQAPLASPGLGGLLGGIAGGLISSMPF